MENSWPMFYGSKHPKYDGKYFPPLMYPEYVVFVCICDT